MYQSKHAHWGWDDAQRTKCFLRRIDSMLSEREHEGKGNNYVEFKAWEQKVSNWIQEGANGKTSLQLCLEVRCCYRECRLIRAASFQLLFCLHKGWALTLGACSQRPWGAVSHRPPALQNPGVRAIEGHQESKCRCQYVCILGTVGILTQKIS